MKLLFVENKYKTKFYKAISKELSKYNYQSYFLIQNKLFSTGENDYFTSSNYDIEQQTPELEALFAKCLEKIKKSDRNLNYFGGNSKHYKAYFYNIFNAINEVKPDVVFGESTLFHELITIFICNSKDILYLHPSSCRIPSKRFSFYIGDSLIPYLGSQESATNEYCVDIVQGFGYRTKILDYMAVPKRINSLFKKGRFLRNWLTGLLSRVIGERFNTPSLMKKISLQRSLKKNIGIWEVSAQSQLSSTKKKILYPLHMQPECNIDVWSVKYRDQRQTIEHLAQIIPDNWELIVKPNPKSKYELDLKLIEACSTYENITLLSHTVKMQDVLGDIDLFITASGTVSYECALTNSPCLSLALPYFEQYCIERHLETLVWEEMFSKYNQQIKSLKSSGEDLVRYLIKTSYSGVISDPISDPDCLLADNISNLSKAFQSVLSHIKERKI